MKEYVCDVNAQVETIKNNRAEVNRHILNTVEQIASASFSFPPPICADINRIAARDNPDPAKVAPTIIEDCKPWKSPKSETSGNVLTIRIKKTADEIPTTNAFVIKYNIPLGEP
jgi:hypothetical protein